jgi:hypothetical protein
VEFRKASGARHETHHSRDPADVRRNSGQRLRRDLGRNRQPGTYALSRQAPDRPHLSAGRRADADGLRRRSLAAAWHADHFIRGTPTAQLGYLADHRRAAVSELTRGPALQQAGTQTALIVQWRASASLPPFGQSCSLAAKSGRGCVVKKSRHVERLLHAQRARFVLRHDGLDEWHGVRQPRHARANSERPVAPQRWKRRIAFRVVNACALRPMVRGAICVVDQFAVGGVGPQALVVEPG